MSRAAFLVAHPRTTALRAINYSLIAERIRRQRGQHAPRFGDLINSIGASFGVVFTRIDCGPEAGVQLLSQVDIFAAEPSGRVVRRDSMPRPDQHRVLRGQLLFAGAGQMGASTLFGRCVVADARLDGMYLGPDIIAVNLKKPEVEGLYAYAFLSSDAGLSLVRSSAYGTSIPRIRLDLLSDLPIPMPDASIMTRIAGHVRKSLDARERHSRELASARAIVEALPEMQAAFDECAVRKARVGTNKTRLHTLSAWNYVSCGEALSILQRASSATLGDVLPQDGLFRGPRFARVRCSAPFGLPFLSQRDVFLSRPHPQRIRRPGVDSRWLFSPANSLLVSGSGSLSDGDLLGRVIFVSPQVSEFAISEHMLRVQPIRGYSPLVFAFLSTLVGRRLLRSTAVGTVILSMRQDLIRGLPLPSVNAQQAEAIARHVHAAMEARDEADKHESSAQKLINSEVLQAWLS